MIRFWSAILVVTGLVLGLVGTCVAPFVAVAVLAARTLAPRSAFGVILAMWLGNQAIGFGFEHFPHDAATIAWGLAILVTTCAAAWIARRVPTTALAFVAGFAAFEGLQFAYAVAIGDAANFTVAIDAQIFAGNLLGIAILGAIRLVLTADRSGVRSRT